jgi:hypothetical protein
MKARTPRQRIDVNVEELDRIIDDAKSAPLSESDNEKLKAALHALADRLLPQLKTNKTSVVCGDAEPPSPEQLRSQTDRTATGHGRNGANAYRGAEKIAVTHTKLAHGDRCPDCARGNVYT